GEVNSVALLRRFPCVPGAANSTPPFSRIAATSSESPESPGFVATVRTTGQPSIPESLSQSTEILRVLHISHLFSATRRGTPSSASCSVRKRLRPKFSASTTLITRSGFCLARNSPEIPSSAVYGTSEYVPGRSTTLSSTPGGQRSCLTGAADCMTVTPGQFP